MDAELLSTYNFLMAAVAQTFAALVALSAMFYVYRLNSFDRSQRSAGERMRHSCATAQAAREREQESEGLFSAFIPKVEIPNLREQRVLNSLKHTQDEVLAFYIMDIYKLEEENHEYKQCADAAIDSALEVVCYLVHARGYRRKILITLLVNSSVIAFALFALPFGKWFLDLEVAWLAILSMVAVISAGGTSLVLSVQLIWKLLKGPQVGEWVKMRLMKLREGKNKEDDKKETEGNQG
ncbi:hypothetical protein JXM67_11605 [candidate division WOR-3 bacterium]|nr:hypothetical protein [candidate division WOR-3 bacterium]